MAEPAARLTDQERETLAVALHGMTCHLATGESCGVADEYDRADAVVIGATVEGMIAARLAPVWAILNAWEAWDGAPGPDGKIHPDASSPRDRDRLRAALLTRPEGSDS